MATTQHKIVIVDADAIDRARYRQFLLQAPDANYVIWEADRADNAQATIERSQPDGILVNSHMLDRVGTEFLHRVENGHSLFPFAMVILTQAPHDGTPWGALQLEACESLVQDQVTPDLLCRTMRYVIEKREWLRRLDEQQRAVTDCTRHVQQLEEQLQQAQASERLAAVGTTAVYLTHHLGNRFNNLSTSVQLLERRLNTAPARHDLQIRQIVQDVHEEIRRSLLLLQDLRLLSNVHTLQVQPVAITEVVNAVLHSLEQLSTKSGIQLVVDIPAGLPPALADLEKLGQVVLNLCTNAVEAMPQGGTLTLHVSATQTQVLLEVRDTGVGIAPDLMVFEPFISTKPGSTGLGLTIAWQLMVAQHGAIAYTSTLGQGTTFTLTLPAVT